MTRQEMIRRYSEIQDCTYEEAKTAIDTVTTLIYDGLIEDGRSSVKYLGKFEIKNYKKHKGFDFQNGKMWKSQRIIELNLHPVKSYEKKFCVRKL